MDGGILLVGPGKIIDTNIFFVICTNVLGGCMGTTGPSSINPKTKKPFGLKFPVITIGDMVKVQNRLIEKLGIEKIIRSYWWFNGWYASIGMGLKYSNKINSVIPIASSYRHSAQNIAFHEIGRQAIMADPNWKKGNYYSQKNFPKRGLSHVARMIAHITYLSENALQRKFEKFAK